MKKFIAIAALLSTQAFANPTLGIDVASLHDVDGFNNSNQGVYLTWHDETGDGPAIGTYYNSLYKQTTWAGYVSESRFGNVSGALLVGLATGYKSYAVPMIVPSLAYHYGNNAVRLHLIPGVIDGSTAVHLSLEHNF